MYRDNRSILRSCQASWEEPPDEDFDDDDGSSHPDAETAAVEAAYEARLAREMDDYWADLAADQYQRELDARASQ